MSEPAVPVPGHATGEATRAVAGAGGRGGRPLGGTGLLVGPLGFGGYRVDDETPDHRAALLAALRAGCNLIDTSTNYTDGGSERLVGAVLADAGRDGLAAREAIVVVSKIGYVQGSNLRLAMERDRAGAPFPEMVRYMDGCWHCIHPVFLEDQLARSRARLRLETLDVCLLHNPEYFLSDALKHGGAGDLEARRDAFYLRLTAAFGFLEEAVRRGAIRCYGVSSNTAVADPSDPEATSVDRMLQAAVAAGGAGHHFRVMQIPMNLIESGGAVTPNTGPRGGQTALQAAAGAGLAVLVNRPLNALVGHRLLRLADTAGRSVVEALSHVIDPRLPEERRGETLSRKALWILAGTPGVSSVLVGMRRPAWVDDAMAIAAWPPCPDPLAVYRAIATMTR